MFLDEREHSHAVLASVPVHEPVFFCTVEVQSITQEKGKACNLDNLFWLFVPYTEEMFRFLIIQARF